jgi:hypothetical protein
MNLLRAALLAVPGLVSATELYSWHSFDSPVVDAKKVQLILHHRTRTRHELSYLDQSRVGSILRWKAKAGLIPFVGYYFQPQQLRHQEWTRGHRVFTGVEAPFRPAPSLAVTTRLAAEHFMRTGRQDYNRYRSYARLVIGRGRVSPFVQNEVLAVRQGFHSTRNSGGLRFAFRHVTLEAGYLYDIRRMAWGGDRQAIVTSLRYERRER